MRWKPPLGSPLHDVQHPVHAAQAPLMRAVQEGTSLASPVRQYCQERGNSSGRRGPCSLGSTCNNIHTCMWIDRHEMRAGLCWSDQKAGSVAHTCKGHGMLRDELCTVIPHASLPFPVSTKTERAKDRAGDGSSQRGVTHAMIRLRPARTAQMWCCK